MGRPGLGQFGPRFRGTPSGPNRSTIRLKNEYKLLDRAKEQPILRLGRLRGRPGRRGQSAYEKVITDSLWIITVGNRGLFGLVALLAALLTPVLRFLRRDPPRLWTGPLDAPAAVLAVILSLYLLDHMVNAMVNPVFALVAGGLAGAARPRFEGPLLQ